MLPDTAQVTPGHWLGVMGGGQLGRMFCHAAQAMGYRVAVLDPDPDAPAGRAADRHLCAAYDDPTALDELAALCVAVTTEFENVPAASLERLAQQVRVAPAAAAVAISQDRILEKNFLTDCGVPVAPYCAIEDETAWQQVDPALFPGILKTARLGYDGKGQVSVADAAQARAAWDQLGRVRCVLEARLPLAAECSVVLARGLNGDVAAYPPIVNEHRDGILAVSRFGPGRQGAEIRQAALTAAGRVAAALSYTGVLCVEFFVLSDGRIVANEMAPRPHNSGHLTIEACVTSQFEQQARALAGWPLGDTDGRCEAVMLNLLGDLWFDAQGNEREPDWGGVLAVAGARLHLYSKAQARRGRKMGHVTVLGDTPQQVDARVMQVAQVLGLQGFDVSFPDAPAAFVSPSLLDP